jgi:hypothetical protein
MSILGDETQLLGKTVCSVAYVDKSLSLGFTDGTYLLVCQDFNTSDSADIEVIIGKQK